MMNRMWMMVGRGKFFLIFGLSLLFGLSERGSAQGLLPFHLLAVLNDQYYFVFAVLPVFLFLCTGVMEDDMLFVLVRYGTYRRYFFRKWRALSVIAVFFWLVQMAALLCSGLGLPFDGSWPGAPAGQWREVFTLLQGYFPSPWAAVLCCAGQMLLGYWLIALTALCLGHFCSRSLAVKLLLALYLFAALWIKLPVMSRPPFVFLTGWNHWVFLLHNLAEPWRLPLTAVTTAIVTMGMVWLVTRRWYWRFSVSVRGKKGLGPYYRRVLFTGKNGLLLAGLMFLVMAWTWISGGVPEDSTDWLIRLFAGHGTGSFYPMGFMALLAIEVLPLWPLGVFCTQAVGERSVFLTVRLRRRKELLEAILCTGLLWILLYGCLLILAAAVPPLLLGFSPDIGLSVTAVGLKLLDVGFQFLLILSVLCVTGQATAGFVTVVLLHFLCVLPISWLPAGLSSLARLNLPQTGGTMPGAAAAVLLGTCSLALLLWLSGRGIKRLFNH